MPDDVAQLDLLTWRPTPEAERQFAEHDARNPHIWALFVRFTCELIAHGHLHGSSDAVLHRIRWHTLISETPGAGWKINNNWTPFYARKFHETYLAHSGFFRTRRAKADA